MPEGHLLCDMVCTVEVEDGQEEERVPAVLGAVPGQRYAAAVPGRHLKVLGNIWVWMNDKELDLQYSRIPIVKSIFRSHSGSFAF